MIDIGRGVKLIRRSEWGARPPRSVSGINATFGTTAHWEGPHMGYPWDHAACFSLVRGIQNFHMDSRGWQDIAYSGLPCPHGHVFEGRWAGRRTAANGTNDGNNRALALCYLGGQGDAFTADGQRAMRAAMDWLDAHGGAGPGRNGHRDWKPTECPGDAIYRWVHTGQPAGGAHAPAPAPRPEEDDDMQPYVLKLVNTSPQRYAFVLPDATIIDKDRNGGPLNDGAEELGALRACFPTAKVMDVAVNARQVDVVQEMIREQRA